MNVSTFTAKLSRNTLFIAISILLFAFVVTLSATKIIRKLGYTEGEMAATSHEIETLKEKIRELENGMSQQEKALQEQVSEQVLGKDIALEEVESQKQRLDKEEACRKVNELSIAPTETKVYSYYEGQPRYASWAPDTTKELLDYMKAYWEHYQATGDHYYQHNPDYFPEMVGKHLPILESRYQEYLKYKELCRE